MDGQARKKNKIPVRKRFKHVKRHVVKAAAVRITSNHRILFMIWTVLSVLILQLRLLQSTSKESVPSTSEDEEKLKEIDTLGEERDLSVCVFFTSVLCGKQFVNYGF